MNFKRFLEENKNVIHFGELSKWELIAQTPVQQTDAVNCGRFLLGFARKVMDLEQCFLKSVDPKREASFYESLILKESDNLSNFCLVCIRDI